MDLFFDTSRSNKLIANDWLCGYILNSRLTKMYTFKCLQLFVCQSSLNKMVKNNEEAK